MKFNNDRLIHWFAGVLIGWAIWSLLLFIPVFHHWLGFPIAKIAGFAGAGCAVQLAVTPWLFSARRTDENPDGKIGRRCAALAIWFALWTELLLLYFLSAETSQSGRSFILCWMVASPFIWLLIHFLSYKALTWRKTVS
jgi:hypothetical protein